MGLNRRNLNQDLKSRWMAFCVISLMLHIFSRHLDTSLWEGCCCAELSTDRIPIPMQKFEFTMQKITIWPDIIWIQVVNLTITGCKFRCGPSLSLPGECTLYSCTAIASTRRQGDSTTHIRRTLHQQTYKEGSKNTNMGTPQTQKEDSTNT